MLWQQSNDAASEKQHNNKRNGVEGKEQSNISYFLYLLKRTIDSNRRINKWSAERSDLESQGLKQQLLSIQTSP